MKFPVFDGDIGYKMEEKIRGRVERKRINEKKGRGGQWRKLQKNTQKKIEIFDIEQYGNKIGSFPIRQSEDPISKL